MRTLPWNPLVKFAVPTWLIVALAACAPAPPPAAEGAAASPQATVGGRITGAVTLDGPVAPRGTIRFDADPQCAAVASDASTLDASLLVSGSQGVQNVFVYLQEGVDTAAHTPPTAPAVLDQQRCQYVPRVSGVQVGQTLLIRNSDSMLHTVRADARINSRFNVATPLKGMEIKRSWSRPEVMVPIGCDMHPWMHAYVGVLPHPYFAVTDAEGRFAIEGVPPGTYTVAAWHERLGTRTHDVVVPDSGAAAVDFVYTTTAGQD